MLKKIARFWKTVKYLKPVQVKYQLYYRLKRSHSKAKGLKCQNTPQSANHSIDHANWISSYETYANQSFCFLNKTKRFEDSIDWDFQEFGKLWTYNLTYFDYLLQQNMDRETGLKLIHNFIESEHENKAALDPYPISLRSINWIKFCLKFDVNQSVINKSLHKQLWILEDNLEYHLMGNHLLENGYALFIGGIYFEDDKILKTGKEILQTQLYEQVLDDGGHFERSPMYHQILLSRLMDCYNLANNSEGLEVEFIRYLKRKAELMLGWLYHISFNDGAIPRVNDASDGIAPSTEDIRAYAERLELAGQEHAKLGESGYRMIKGTNYEWLVDVGNIGPDYIPGHAHSDTFSFVLYVRNKPFIVDTGVSTYEECDQRLLERSTAAHNTVEVNGTEQTEVWKAFRVGRRAYVTKLDEENNNITAEHSGYKHFGIIHRRIFKWNESELIIIDQVRGNEEAKSTAFLHFHPNVSIKKNDGKVFADEIELSFSDHKNLRINSYQYAEGFNALNPATVLEIEFQKTLETQVKI